MLQHGEAKQSRRNSTSDPIGPATKQVAKTIFADHGNTQDKLQTSLHD
jgi:hypothetical protein